MKYMLIKPKRFNQKRSYRQHSYNSSLCVTSSTIGHLCLTPERCRFTHQYIIGTFTSPYNFSIILSRDSIIQRYKKHLKSTNNVELKI